MKKLYNEYTNNIDEFYNTYSVTGVDFIEMIYIYNSDPCNQNFELLATNVVYDPIYRVIALTSDESYFGELVNNDSYDEHLKPINNYRVGIGCDPVGFTDSHSMHIYKEQYIIISKRSNSDETITRDVYSKEFHSSVISCLDIVTLNNFHRTIGPTLIKVKDNLVKDNLVSYTKIGNGVGDDKSGLNSISRNVCGIQSSQRINFSLTSVMQKGFFSDLKPNTTNSIDLKDTSKPIKSRTSGLDLQLDNLANTLANKNTIINNRTQLEIEQSLNDQFKDNLTKNSRSIANINLDLLKPALREIITESFKLYDDYFDKLKLSIKDNINELKLKNVKLDVNKNTGKKAGRKKKSSNEDTDENNELAIYESTDIILNKVDADRIKGSVYTVVLRFFSECDLSFSDEDDIDEANKKHHTLNFVITLGHMVIKLYYNKLFNEYL